MNRVGICWLVYIILFNSLPATWAQHDEDEEPSPYQPALIGEYQDAAGHRATRLDATIAFAWKDSAADQRLEPGPFRVHWKGLLLAQHEGMYSFSVHTSGKSAVRLDEQTILDVTEPSEQPAWHVARPVELSFGWHPLEVTFTSDDVPANISLYWSGPGFDLEPVPPWHLFHDASARPNSSFERGRELARALRCEACHFNPDSKPAILDAPSLRNIDGQLHAEWLVAWLADKSERDGAQETAEDWPRRMPHFGLTRSDARALAAYLLPHSPDASSTVTADRTQREAGRKIFLTVGCLACHGLETYGDANLFGGGDLSQIAAKRPASYFAKWLSDPASLNSRHRMPVFELTVDERDQLVAFLSSLGAPSPALSAAAPELAQRGSELFVTLRCGACHDGPAQERDAGFVSIDPLGPDSHWQHGCFQAPVANSGRPTYPLSKNDQAALQEYFTSVGSLGSRQDMRLSETDGGRVLIERNCLACHARGLNGGMAAQLPRLVEAFPDLAPAISALTPPSLNSVGDKLHDHALAGAIRREGAVRRPWLDVRMPRFNLRDGELKALVDHLIQADRIPDLHPHAAAPVAANVSEQLGARLVTQDGFGCTSCHAVGAVRAPNAPLHTLGPDLLQLDRRIRREWFDRWVRNPARIVPRMEMPSVQTPVAGILNEQLDLQLAAVWETLNRPEFRPPDPQPVRVVRRSGMNDGNERTVALTDVLEHGGTTYIKPLLAALPNRHNLLLDLQEATVAGWWMGDAARQRTRGKTWYWESAGSDLFPAPLNGPDLQLAIGDQWYLPSRTGQFITEFDELLHEGSGLRMTHRVHFARDGDDHTLTVSQLLLPNIGDSQSGIARSLRIAGMPAGSRLKLRVCGELDSKHVHHYSRELVFTGPTGPPRRLRIMEPVDASFDSGGAVEIAELDGEAFIAIQYLIDAVPEQIVAADVSDRRHPLEKLSIIPGFDATRLPTPDSIMPTGLAWTPGGELIVTSLKGQVWRVRDSDSDGFEDELMQASDELATPYGIVAGDDYLDVINKYALLRLVDSDGDGFAERMATVASGWGHTADYHDWAVGLEPDANGGYWIALPCQQDQRSTEAARFRGTLLRLTPREPTSLDPRLFTLEPFSFGHRFPMGLARDLNGELFVTDNQGNYNPFNELNHVRRNAHYGFINALERKKNVTVSSLAAPAVNIPHPWTRSVNGICLLKTPQGLDRQNVFGPFEGHLIGCEYDLRKLVRISLECVEGTYQGATYPLTIDQPADGATLIGPLVAAISPRGEVYVGCIRDSGWGGANNIGGLVRITPAMERLPAGIAEVNALVGGFRIVFTQPVDADRAAVLENYVISSYRRVATADYGGPDVERRVERPKAARVADDRMSVDLQFTELREGFVYEFHLRNLAMDDSGKRGVFFPAEAYYTLHVIPGKARARDGQ